MCGKEKYRRECKMDCRDRWKPFTKNKMKEKYSSNLELFNEVRPNMISHFSNRKTIIMVEKLQLQTRINLTCLCQCQQWSRKGFLKYKLKTERIKIMNRANNLYVHNKISGVNTLYKRDHAYRRKKAVKNK